MQSILTKRYASSSSLGSSHNSEPTNCYNALIKYLAHLGRRAKRKLWRQYKLYRKQKRRAAASAQKSGRNSIKSNQLNHLDRPTRKRSSSKRSSNRRKKEHAKESAKEPGKESTKESTKESAKEPGKDPGKAPANEAAGQPPDITCIKLAEPGDLSGAEQKSEIKPQRPLISCLRTNRTEHIICPIAEQNGATSQLGIQHLSIQTNLTSSHSANHIFQNSITATGQPFGELANSSSNFSFNLNGGQQRPFANHPANLPINPNFAGSAAVLAGRSRRHGSVPTLYLRPNRPEAGSATNFLVSTLDGNYLTNAPTKAANFPNLKPPPSGQLAANSLHWSPRPTLIRTADADGAQLEEQLKLGDEEDSEDDEVEREYEEWVAKIQQTFWYRVAAKSRKVLQVIVDHRYFQRFIFLAIIFNTVSMGIEYHNQPLIITKSVEYANLFFTGIFMLEMFLKLFAHGCYVYISDGFNVFDGIVVIVR